MLTSSRIVAEVFEKRHDHVLRDIDALMGTSPDLGNCPWFRPVITETPGGNGATLRTRSFDMTRDGMTLLAMGFTGVKALRFKMLYIQAFNEMEQRLRQIPAVNLNDPATLRQMLLGYTEQVIQLQAATAVFARGADVLTSSRIVAEVFEKEHKNVLRDIDALINGGSDLSDRSWFQPVITETVGGNGAIQRSRSYDMTRDGMTLLAMGFTGAKALRFKMLYIAAFNEMEQRVMQPVDGIAPERLWRHPTDSPAP